MSLSPVSCSHKQSHEVQELTKHPIKKNPFSSTCTKIFPSTREYFWDPQHIGQWERNKRDKVLQAASAIAKHFTGCKPDTVGTLTWRKTPLTPHFAIVATMNMWDDAPFRYTHQILKHSVGTPAPWVQHPDTNEQELVNTKWRKPLHWKSDLERNSMVSVVWSNVHHDSLAQPVNLTSKTRWKTSWLLLIEMRLQGKP